MLSLIKCRIPSLGQSGLPLWNSTARSLAYFFSRQIKEKCYILYWYYSLLWQKTNTDMCSVSYILADWCQCPCRLGLSYPASRNCIRVCVWGGIIIRCEWTCREEQGASQGLTQSSNSLLRGSKHPHPWFVWSHLSHDEWAYEVLQLLLQSLIFYISIQCHKGNTIHLLGYQCFSQNDLCSLFKVHAVSVCCD